jgi:hypothetical protein
VILTKASAILSVANFMMKPGLSGQSQCVDSMATGIRLSRLPLRAVHDQNNTTIIITSKSSKPGHRGP